LGNLATSVYGTGRTVVFSPSSIADWAYASEYGALFVGGIVAFLWGLPNYNNVLSPEAASALADAYNARN
jgi:hypothetical protein